MKSGPVFPTFPTFSPASSGNPDYLIYTEIYIFISHTVKNIFFNQFSTDHRHCFCDYHVRLATCQVKVRGRGGGGVIRENFKY